MGRAHGCGEATALTHAQCCHVHSPSYAHPRPRRTPAGSHLPAQDDERPGRLEQRGHRPHGLAALGTPRRVHAEAVVQQHAPRDRIRSRRSRRGLSMPRRLTRTDCWIDRLPRLS
jgi:hypothetical protein